MARRNNSQHQIKSVQTKILCATTTTAASAATAAAEEAAASMAAAGDDTEKRAGVALPAPSTATSSASDENGNDVRKRAENLIVFATHKQAPQPTSLQQHAMQLVAATDGQLDDAAAAANHVSSTTQQPPLTCAAQLQAQRGATTKGGDDIEAPKNDIDGAAPADNNKSCNDNDNDNNNNNNHDAHLPLRHTLYDASAEQHSVNVASANNNNQQQQQRQSSNSSTHGRSQQQNIHNYNATDANARFDVELDATNYSAAASKAADAAADAAAAAATPNSNAKCRQLSYVQVLFLRKWPFLAIGICAMASLCFAILISTLTVYLLHLAASGECSALASHLSAMPSMAAAGGGPGSKPAMAGALNYDLRRLEQTGADASSLEHSPLSIADRQLSGRSSANGRGVAAAADESGSPAATVASNSSSSANQTQQSLRLPTSLEPSHYELFVQPKLYAPFEFDGSVTITLKCVKRNTRNVTLNANELRLREASLRLELVSSPQQQNSSSTKAAAAAAEVPAIVGLKMDEKLQLAVIELSDELQLNAEYKLSVEFVGQLNNDLAGFYKMRYKQQQNTLSTGNESTTTTSNSLEQQTTWIAATQFQPTDARRAFPCFDEPIFKSTFGIKIKHWKNMTALSNMPIVESVESSDKVWITDTFAKSAKMSTYLVAFAVTNFESRSEGNISVWARPGLVHTAEYSLKIAGKILRHYEDFFGTKFPLPKMDMIALPDFNAGAMENWGLITYRETAMLYDPHLSTIANKERVATVVAHELAHQWFGNLVTPKWWDDLWLNEGFASYVEYIGVDYVEPQWRIMDAFVIEEMQAVMSLDSLSSSHRISIPVHRPDEIHEIFDQITYSKGASIIRMMNAFLTDEVFKLGLRRYLLALKYSNADQSDLWRHLVEAQRLVRQPQQHNNSATSTKIFVDSHAKANSDGEFDESIVDVESVMNSWTLQSGYPIVTLTRDYSSATPVATVSQKPFLLLKTNVSSSSSNKASTIATNSNNIEATEQLKKTWEVPITYTWKSAVFENETRAMQTKTKLWLHKNDTSEVKLLPNRLPKSNDDWILMNINQVGFYRVNYDMQNWQLLASQLATDHRKIRPVNRAQLINDMFELARNSMLDYQFVMNATRYLKNERDYLPWYTASLNFHSITQLLERKPIFGLWKRYMNEVMESRFAIFKNMQFTTDNEFSSSVKKLHQTNNNATDVAAIDDDAHNDLADNFHKSQSLFWLCKLTRDCQLKAKSAFDEWKATKVNKINPTLRKTIYCTAIATGGESDWDFLWQAYLKEQSAVERDRIIRALGCSRDPWILNRYLSWTFDKTLSSGIRRQDGSAIFTSVANNEQNHGLAFTFMRENWQTILDMFGHQSFGFSQLVESSASRMNTRSELDEFKRFFDSIQNATGSGQRAYLQTIEEIEASVAWMDRYYPQLEQWLKQYFANKQQ